MVYVSDQKRCVTVQATFANNAMMSLYLRAYDKYIILFTHKANIRHHD